MKNQRALAKRTSQGMKKGQDVNLLGFKTYMLLPIKHNGGKYIYTNCLITTLYKSNREKHNNMFYNYNE